MDNIKFPKKISTATMGLATRQLEEVAEANKPHEISVLRIWGTVNGKVPGVSQFGSYNKFTGNIAALNLITSEEARSSALLLPGIAEAVVLQVLDKALKDGGSANIALEITITYNPPKTTNSNFTKFTYGVKPLIEFKGEDALAQMGAELPAPKFVKSLEDRTASKKR